MTTIKEVRITQAFRELGIIVFSDELFCAHCGCGIDESDRHNTLECCESPTPHNIEIINPAAALLNGGQFDHEGGVWVFPNGETLRGGMWGVEVGFRVNPSS